MKDNTNSFYSNNSYLFIETPGSKTAQPLAPTEAPPPYQPNIAPNQAAYPPNTAPNQAAYPPNTVPNQAAYPPNTAPNQAAYPPNTALNQGQNPAYPPPSYQDLSKTGHGPGQPYANQYPPAVSLDTLWYNKSP